MTVHLSYCSGSAHAELPGWREITRTASEPVRFIDDPAKADFILVTGFDDRDHFRVLRSNRVWRRYPEKSFGLFEGDNAPRYLHGLYCGVPQKWNATGRFSGLAYRWHQEQFPGRVPLPEQVRARPKDYLFSYIGRSSNRVRRRLLGACCDLPDARVEDSSAVYNHFSKGAEVRGGRQDYYWDVLSRAKYGLCPAGAAPSSVRLFELMEAGIAPVVIADQWVPPHGPDWDRFCLRVPEARVAEIHALVKQIEPEFEERGRLARQAWEQWFAPERYWDFLIASLRHIQANQRVPEKIYTLAMPFFLSRAVFSRRLFDVMVAVKSKVR